MLRFPFIAFAASIVFTADCYSQVKRPPILPAQVPSNTSAIAAAGNANTVLPPLPANSTPPRQPTSGVTKVVFEGDSLTSGNPWTDGLFTAFPGAIKVNVANAGDSAANMVNTFSAQVAPHAPLAGQTSWLVLMAGVNDLYSYGGATVYESLKSIWALGRARGFKVCAATLADSNFLTGFDPPSIRGELTKLNFLIRQDPSLYDALLPVDLWFPDATDSTLFNPDQLHMSATGYVYFGKMAASLFAANTVSATALTPETVSSVVWRDDLKRLTAEYATAFQPMDLDRFTQISTGTGANFVPAYYGDYLFTVPDAPGNSAGLTARYPTNTSSDNIQWNPVTKRGVMLHSRRYFGVGAAGIVRVLVGAGVDTLSGPLDRTGFGFECTDTGNNHQIRAVAHNGTTLVNGPWVPRYSANTQWFTFCINGTVTLWERFNIGADWSDWKLLQTLTGGPVAQNGTASEMIRINAEGGPTPSAGSMFVDIIQVALTIGLDRPYDLWPR